MPWALPLSPAAATNLPIAADVRAKLRAFVDALLPEQRSQVYYANASLQNSQWRACEIVQNCEVPAFGCAHAAHRVANNLVLQSRNKDKEKYTQTHTITAAGWPSAIFPGRIWGG
jgi:hypothetical protein